MTALSAESIREYRKGQTTMRDLAADAVIYRGALVGLNSSGYLVPMSASTSLTCVGVAQETADNTDGDAGDLSVEVQSGCFKFTNSADADEITRAEIGSACYAQDDDTVAKLATSRSAAGIVYDIDDDGGVWVEVGPDPSPDGDLLAANNLSDVVDADEARQNLSVTHIVQLRGLPLDADGVFRYVHVGPDATITSAQSVTSGATTTTAEACTIALAIEGTPVTNGTITIAGASAAGTVDSATPSAANVISAGEVLTATVTDGSQIEAATADLSLLMTY